MSVPLPQKISPNNPINDQAIVDTVHELGVTLDTTKVPEYADFLKGIWEIWNRVDAMPDYVPRVNKKRFPRKEVRQLTAQENPHNAWAWRVHIQGDQQPGLPLSGRSVCVKDNVAVEGVPCLLGTDFIKDWVPNTDATVVTRILEAGGNLVGKAVCENLSLWGASDSSSTGQIDNPYGKGYSAGGSSSGTAVLVAREEVDLGIGGDQGGSIRIPASKTGIVGLKPSFGLVPYTGIASFEATLDHTGPMTRTVLDNAILLQAIAGVDGIDDRQQAGCPFPRNIPDYPKLARRGVEGLRVGLLAEGFDCPLHDRRVSRLVEAAAKRLATLGATVDSVSVPMHRNGPDLWAIIGRMSAVMSWGGKACGRRQLYLDDLTEKMVPMTQDKFDSLYTSGVNTIINGHYAWKHMPSTLLGKAYNLVRKLRDEYDIAFATHDVLIMPTIPFLAPRLANPHASATAQMASATGLTTNTSPFNLTGFPALSIPVGQLAAHDDRHVLLPVGMQVVGKMYNEDLLYRVGYAWEQSFDWKTFGLDDM